MVVDSEFDVAESNENNNSLTKQFTWVGPDLVIDDITLSPSAPGPGDGTLTATIRNAGPVGTATFLNIDIEMFIDGVPCDTGILIGGLGAGSTATENTSSCNPTEPGTYEITFVVDSTGEVPEMDEDNNTFSKFFTWTGPDLAITELILEPGKPTVNVGKLIGTIENIGTVDTDLFLNIDVDMYLDDVLCDTGVLLGGLGAGNSATEESTDCNPNQPGVHTVRWEVDPLDEVPEVDETNNSLEVDFEWIPEDPCNVQEVCDYVDNDCDGLTDEGYEGVGLECDGDTDSDSCKGGTWECTADGFGLECVGDTTNQVETCDGTDEDCDGWPDDDFTELGTDCTWTSTDGCEAPGVFACKLDTTGVECVLAADDADEACDGIDNDCDGETDEPYPTVGLPCAVGTGACKVVGVNLCTTDGAGVVCGAEPLLPGDETCDGTDDDCDGVTDEDCACQDGETQPCGTDVGECQAGQQECVGGVFGAECVDEIVPTDEVCDDALDNDCDGSTDEGCGCTPGDTRPCSAEGCTEEGQQTCSDQGFWSPCDVSGLAEVCGDGVDNDCDGETDENCPDVDPEVGPEVGPDVAPDAPVEMIPDAGPDATPDAPVEMMPDAGADAVADVGTSPGGEEAGGCSDCASGQRPSPGGLLWVFLTGLVLWWRRRRWMRASRTTISR